jgi:phosphatidate cytidylyltransferase
VVRDAREGTGAATVRAMSRTDEGEPAPPPPSPAPAHSRAGRNLPAAIAVGVGLAVVILVPLFTVRVGWVCVIAAAISVGTYELARALRVLGRHVPLVPVVAGAAASPFAAYAAGTDGLLLAVAATIVAAVAFRLADSAAGILPDIAAAVFTTAYVALPAGFAALLTRPPDGPRRVLTFLLTVVASDIGGYAAGVLSGGRHKLAPTVSPGKSWEGLAGSIAACVVTGTVCVGWLLSGDWWEGVLFGLAAACTGTVGDLGESMLKRDIGIKDMGTLLPGHGGFMDRLDSLLCTAPAAWLLISWFVPGG